MNRKNLTAAVLAGLAGAAGIAGTAQAVNINPDGLGQVLIYPYYTSNDGNQTLLSVINTTDNAKAVKVRFLEGFNSREVLDFNLYMSHHDVWIAAIAEAPGVNGGVPTLYIPDDSCTVPYLYQDMAQDVGGTMMGVQPFLDLAYTGKFNDGGPESIQRAAEGHFEMIEMGTLVGDSADDATHQFVTYNKDKDDEFTVWQPGDCDQLVENWTKFNPGPDGIWMEEAQDACSDPDPRGDCAQAYTDTERNSGGLFGGAAVINAVNGTMYSYDAKAIQGFDKTDDGIHFVPGTIHPSLDDGDQDTAYIFFGAPKDSVEDLSYSRGVDALSAVFMHENLMNEYVIDDALSASTEWVITFPTKNFYVDEERLPADQIAVFWFPDPTDIGCNGWLPGDPNPVTGNPYSGDDTYDPNDTPPPDDNNVTWEFCTFVSTTTVGALHPFTEVFDGEACEFVSLQTWDRDERTFSPDDPGGSQPPVVSPSLPGCNPAIENCTPDTPFELCYEVNVLRFGDGVIFGTPEIEGSSLLLTVENEYDAGWGRIDFGADPDHVDENGLVGLPVTGFAAMEYENNFADGADVKAFYGGLFGHKGNVRQTAPLRINPQ